MKTMIVIADGSEECEALLTYDLLYRAGIDVELVGLKKTVVSSHDVTVQAHRTIDEIDPEGYECLILPGGMPGTKNLEGSEKVQQLIDLFVQQDKYIAVICAAPSILLHKGLLAGKRFTCFPGFESGCQSTGEKAVRDGKFITGKGLGATIEFASLIIETLKDRKTAEEVLGRICY